MVEAATLGRGGHGTVAALYLLATLVAGVAAVVVGEAASRTVLARLDARRAGGPGERLVTAAGEGAPPQW